MLEFNEDVFDYHMPTDDHVRKITQLRKYAKAFAEKIFDNCPSGADRTSAIRKVREALMTANASIVLDGKI